MPTNTYHKMAIPNLKLSTRTGDNRLNKRPLSKTYILIPPLTGLLFALLATPIWAGDFEDGLKFSFDGNYTSAAISFGKAAEQGVAEAQYELALMYEEGRGVTQDYKLAAMWYLKAAEQDHARAQIRLGVFLLEGRGIPKDNIEAYKWISIANEKDKKGAKMDLSTVASQITKPQLAEAQVRTRKWLKGHTIASQPSKKTKPRN
jgi:TPR repeat protein